MRKPRTTTLAKSFNQLRADYNAAKSSRYRRTRTGLVSTGTNADYHYKSETDFFKIMEIARDMDRNDCIVGQTIDRAVINTVQDGIHLDVGTGDTALDADLAARWHQWANDPDACDITGEMTFADMEYAALRHEFVDGDIIALPNLSGGLQLLEAHRLRTPTNAKKTVIHGVSLSDAGRREKYFITKKDLESFSFLTDKTEFATYDARDEQGNRQVFHIYNPKRVSQTRGISAIAPIVDLLGMFEDINFAKLVQQQIVSCFAIFKERGGEFSGGSYQYGATESETQTDGSTRQIEGIAPGMEISGAVGEKLSGFSPQVPNPEFFMHVKLILQLIGVNLGLPLALVLLDASETNFSGWRGAVDQARMGFRRNQQNLVNKLHRPVYQWKVRQWMADDSALLKASSRSGISIFGHRWNPPTWPYIQPLQDAQADKLRIKALLTSPRRLHAENGAEYSELITEIVEDKAALIRAAIEQANALNQQFPDAAVDWREIAGMEPIPNAQNSDTEMEGPYGKSTV